MVTNQPRDFLRHVALEPYEDGRRWTLLTWDLHRSWDAFRVTVGYEFRVPDGSVLFSGESGSPLLSYDIDSDESLWGLLAFLTVQPSGAPADYFAEYTPEQLAFAASEDAEALGLLVHDAEVFSEENIQHLTQEEKDEGCVPQFIDLPFPED